MSKVFHIWTLQLAKWRLAAESGIEILDVTAKSGVAAFAPSFKDVMNYKSGHLSEAMYTDIYLHRMRDSRNNHPGEWRKLTKSKRTAIVCYCAEGKFCHRHLFVQEYKAYLEKLGHTVVVHGELTKENSVQLKPAALKLKREVYGFHGREDLLSNWNHRGFTVKGVRFEHGEQFMMYCKAMLMGDKVTADKILNERDPGECKRLGKQVSPWDEDLWVLKRKPIMVRGCLQKAREHPEVAELLQSLRGKIIAEASKSDTIWGVGLTKGDPRLQDPDQWLGLNVLGEVWMEVARIMDNDVVF